MPSLSLCIYTLHIYYGQFNVSVPLRIRLPFISSYIPVYLYTNELPEKVVFRNNTPILLVTHRFADQLRIITIQEQQR